MHSSRFIPIFILLLPLLIHIPVQAQNLVRNCDFEEMTACPYAQGQINRCKYWYTPGNGSTDYVHACNGGNFGVPGNQWGTQEARSGVAYAHIILYYSTSGTYREYLQAKLACDLQAGKDYQVSFYISCTDNSRYAIDGIGAQLTDTPIPQSGTGLIEIPGNIHISNPAGHMLNIKDSWMRIEGVYTAQGGEKYITIGNFLTNGELTIEQFPSWNGYFSSYYIEDVRVESVEPMFDLGPDTTICPGTGITFNIGNVCENANLTWENGSTSIVRTISEPGTYSIEGKIGCTDFYDQVVISNPADPGHFLPPDTVICPDKVLDIIPSGTFESYTWQDGSQEPSYTTATEGHFWLEVRDDHGCAYQDSIWVQALEIPAFTLGYDTMICLGTELTLNPGIDSAFHHFLWSDYSSGTSLSISDSGEYWVYVSNPCGEMSDTIFIGTYNCDDVLIAPNAFTPNADGKNDVFMIKAKNISHVKMYIYNRWGTQVFESDDLNQGWDGTFKGSPAPFGTYVWLVIYDAGAGDLSRETKKSKGTVVLLR